MKRLYRSLITVIRPGVRLTKSPSTRGSLSFPSNNERKELFASLVWKSLYFVDQRLQEWRWKQKAMVCTRIIKGCSIISPSYFIPHPHPSRRHHHSFPLITPFARTIAHQSSFFISCTRIWNSLPDHIICAQSADSFKSRLKVLSLFNVIKSLL